MLIPNILLVLEMFFINTYATLVCSKRKRSALETWISMALFSVAVFSVIWLVEPEMGNFAEDRNYRILTLAGFVYLIPLQHMVRQPLRHTFVIFSTFWIYSLIIFAVSYRISIIIFADNIAIPSLVVQTVLYLSTLPIILKFMKQKLVFIIQNIKDRTLGSLMMLTVFVILLLYSLKVSFENGTTPVTEIGIFLVLGICFIITFQLAYSFVDASKSVEALGLKTKMDPLTRLKNREAMLEDASKRMSSGSSFCIIFLDLDNFKSINDNYGHNTGDDYLVSFANSARRLLDSHDKLYRISGDEFVVLKEGKHCEKTCSEFEKLRFLNNPSGIEFLGLSTGFARYPEDSGSMSELLGTADSRMYQNKKMKHKSEVELLSKQNV